MDIGVTHTKHNWYVVPFHEYEYVRILMHMHRYIVRIFSDYTKSL